jgi:DNA-binding transcriptional LysR family regulator
MAPKTTLHPPVPSDTLSATTAGSLLARLRFRHVNCFLAIAQERSLRRAAGRLHLSEPAVSKTLLELESLAGAKLAERSRSGVRLTPAGEQFLRHAVGVARAMETAAAALSGADEPTAAVLQIGALPTLASSLLPQAIARLHAQRPHATVRLSTAANAQMLAALKAGELDLVIGRMAEPSMMQGLSFDLLYAESLSAVVRPGHPLAAQPGTTSPQAILGHSLVVASAGTVPHHHAEAFFLSHGLNLPPGRTETLSVSVARLLVLHSDAVWITPERAADDDIAQGLLVRLNLPPAGTVEPVGILRRSSDTPGELAASFMDMVRDAAANDLRAQSLVRQSLEDR